MNRLDFTDINRFLVSLGVIFYVFAFLLPWLFLRDHSTLEISNDLLDSLSEKSLNLINKRQDYFLLIINSIPWITLVMILLGTTSISVGLIRWFKKQEIIDQLDDIELYERRHNLKSLPEKEVEEKAKTEVQEDKEILQNGEIDKSKIQNKIDDNDSEPVEKLISIENLVLEKIKKDKPIDFNIKSNIRLFDGTTADILLQSFIKSKKDKAIEVKYIQTKSNFKVIEKAIKHLRGFIGTYSNRFQKPMIGFVIVIYKSGIYNDVEIGNLQQTIKEYKKDNRLGNIGVRLYKDNDFDNFDLSFLYN